MRRSALLGMLALIVAACSADAGTHASSTTTMPTTTTITVATTTTDPSPATTEAAGFPVTVSLAGGELTLDSQPDRIISLSPTATEMLFAVGAGKQVVAVDEYSYYPPQAPVTELSGFTPNLEAIAAYNPDLVIVTYDADGIVDALGRLGIPVAVLPAAASLDDVYTQIEQVGALTGHLAEAVAVSSEMQAEVRQIVDSFPEGAESLTYFHELDPTLYSVTSATFIGKVYELFGLQNIADPADTDGFGYPQLSEEYVIAADPDLIFLADVQCCGQSAQTVADRPGWADLTAVRTGGVIEVDADVASRWGPRIVDYLRHIAEEMGAVMVSG